MAYSVEFKPSAVRDLAALPKDAQRRLALKIDSLALDPRPSGCEKIQGGEGLSRVRVGDYRVIYFAEDLRLLILVVKIGHRKDVYRGL